MTDQTKPPLLSDEQLGRIAADGYQNCIEEGFAAWVASAKAVREALAQQQAKVLRAAAECIRDLGACRGGWAWEEVADDVDALAAQFSAAQPSPAGLTDEQRSVPPGFVKPDNDKQVFFYEQDFYVLSNFSAFSVMWDGRRFDTSEHLYHYLKFNTTALDVADAIYGARSAHEAFKLAERNKATRRKDWDAVKVELMRDILRLKVAQHEYVRRKLLATGDRELIEDSWRDDFWGWGPNRDGKNMLGKLWMEIRAELRAALTQEGSTK